MKINRFCFKTLCGLVRFVLFFWHPVFTVEGRENIPDGPCVICGNHSGYADPLWAIFALRQPRMFRIVAKESLLHVPLLKHVFRWIGLIGIRRGEQDIAAIKTCLKVLKDGEKLMIYPEGTRVPRGRIPAKTGAVMLAQRTGCPIVPLYISRHRRPFSPVRAVIGRPIQTETGKPTPESLRRQTDALMDTIYRLGGETA